MKKNYKIVDKGSSRYVVGEVRQYDQKNEMYKRMLWDPDLLEVGKKFYVEPVYPKKKPGYQLEDLSLVNASWHLEDNYGMGIWGGKRDLYSWDWDGKYSYPRVPSGLKIDLDDPQSLAKTIKKAARFLGAAKTGICEVDRRWLYSKGYTKTPEGGKAFEISLPEVYKYAIVMLIETDYDAIACSPDGPATSATGLGYSKMAFLAGLVATFIRGLGYKAIPCGNDTACSVPLAIDAGLGELGRNGLLITPDFGPRVRICKVFTDMPLIVDSPIEFGVWDFCKTCEKCAKNCPSQALPYGDPTDLPIDISNRAGVLRWPIDAKKCATFWANRGIDCANCIRTCPFNKKPGPIHDIARWGIRKTRIFNKSFIFLDSLLGYSKQKSSQKFWSNRK